jgi:integrase
LKINAAVSRPSVAIRYNPRPVDGKMDGMRSLNKLTARFVSHASKGRYADGGGLYLFVSESGSSSWVFRYRLNGKRRDIGLGSAKSVSLSLARRLSAEYREKVALGKDLSNRRHTAPKWGFCVDSYIRSHRAGWKNETQAHQWEQSLADYGPPRDLPVDQVDIKAVMDCLLPIWTMKAETASRLRGRIERILDWAKVSGYRIGENPARWRGHLDKLLPRTQKVAKCQHFSAMPYRDLPEFMARLAERKAPTAMALRFLILTATRTSEVTGYHPREFDNEARLWIIPPERMKARREHRVPLSDPAFSILESGTQFEYSKNGMLYLLKRMKIPYTVHGFRSSFKDWALETTNYANEVSEMALAHQIKDKSEASYRRGDLLDKRRKLMDDWAAFCISHNL